MSKTRIFDRSPDPLFQKTIGSHYGFWSKRGSKKGVQKWPLFWSKNDPFFGHFWTVLGLGMVGDPKIWHESVQNPEITVLGSVFGPPPEGVRNQSGPILRRFREKGAQKGDPKMTQKWVIFGPPKNRVSSRKLQDFGCFRKFRPKLTGPAKTVQTVISGGQKMPKNTKKTCFFRVFATFACKGFNALLAGSNISGIVHFRSGGVQKWPKNGQKRGVFDPKMAIFGPKSDPKMTPFLGGI